VFAHFENASSHSSVSRHSTTKRPLSRGINTSERSTLASSQGTVLGENRLAGSGHERSVSAKPGLHPMQMQPRNYSKVQDLSDSESDPHSGKEHLPTAREQELEAGDEVELYSPHPLPNTATSEQHGIDLDVFKVTNAPRGHYGYRVNWNDISEQYRKQIAHARLIHGQYGAPAPAPCHSCLHKGLECRVYHPNLGPPRAALGACGECRLATKKCDFSGRISMVSDKNHKRTRTLSASGNSPSREDGSWFCTVPGCERASAAFNQRRNLERHISVKHPGIGPIDVVESRKKRRVNSIYMQRESTGSDFDENIEKEAESNALVCPVQDCNSRSAKTRFTKPAVLRQHVVKYHLESIHAKRYEEVKRAQSTTSTTGIIDATSVRSGIVRSGISAGKTQYFCPVPGCDHLNGILPWHNLQNHMAGKHPGSYLSNLKESEISPNGAKNAAGNTSGPAVSQHGVHYSIGMPPPPPIEEYESDWDVTFHTNAKPGEYGHRPETSWTLYEAVTRSRYGACTPTPWKIWRPCPTTMLPVSRTER
jgi:hypothetical protein